MKLKAIPTAISNTLAPAKAENNVSYNLLGLKNENGVYIMNGKKSAGIETAVLSLHTN